MTTATLSGALPTSDPFALKATTGGGKSEVPDAGIHFAVLVGLIDLGTHEDEATDEKTQKKRKFDTHKILLIWELTGSKMTGFKDRNHTIGKDYGLTFSDRSNLRKLVTGWRGTAFAPDEAFDVRSIVGKSCLVNLSHGTSKSTGNTFAKLESVSKPRQGDVIPPPQRVPFIWTVGEGLMPWDAAKKAFVPVGNKAIPDWDWLPFIYGEKVKDFIGRSKEVKNGGHTGEVTQDAQNEPEDDGSNDPF